VKFELTFNCDSACFDHGNLYAEISRILHTTGQVIVSTDKKEGKVFDSCGNNIGEFKLTGY